MSDGRDELRAHVRDEHPPVDAAVVIRGGPDTPSLLRSHARRVNRLFVLDGAEVFGISVFGRPKRTSSSLLENPWRPRMADPWLACQARSATESSTSPNSACRKLTCSQCRERGLRTPIRSGPF